MAVILTRRAAGTAIDGPDEHCPDDQGEVGEPVGSEGEPDRERHAGGAEEVPVAGRFGPVRPRRARMKQIAATRSARRMPVPRLT